MAKRKSEVDELCRLLRQVVKLANSIAERSAAGAESHRLAGMECTREKARAQHLAGRVAELLGDE